MNPNLVHWQRINPTTESPQDINQPRTATHESEGPRPPSYISEDGVEYVLEAQPRSTVYDIPLPPHPSERGRLDDTRLWKNETASSIWRKRGIHPRPWRKKNIYIPTMSNSMLVFCNSTIKIPRLFPCFLITSLSNFVFVLTYFPSSSPVFSRSHVKILASSQSESHESQSKESR